MNKKYIIFAIIVIIAIMLVAGMSLNIFNKQTNTTNSTNANNTTINITHIGNNTDEQSSGSNNNDNGRYVAIRDEEYLGDEVVYRDTYTGRVYYHGQEMDYASLAEEYNQAHGYGSSEESY